MSAMRKESINWWSGRSLTHLPRLSPSHCLARLGAEGRAKLKKRIGPAGVRRPKYGYFARNTWYDDPGGSLDSKWVEFLLSSVATSPNISPRGTSCTHTNSPIAICVPLGARLSQLATLHMVAFADAIPDCGSCQPCRHLSATASPEFSEVSDVQLPEDRIQCLHSPDALGTYRPFPCSSLTG